MWERLVGPQVMKDITLYQLQIQQARLIGKVLIFDEAAMPDGMTKESVMSYLKAYGIAWVNSREYLTSGQTNLFQAVDVGLSESVIQSISLVDYYDRQIDQISGRGPESLGQVPGASTAVGVQQQALGQQSLITAPYFTGFERFCSRVMTQQAKLVKLAWANKEIFAPIIGDTGVDFLSDNTDITLDEFDIQCLSLPPSMADRQKLEQILMTAVQSDPEFIDDALDIMMETDIAVAYKKFKRRRALRKMFLMQQEQMASEQEQMMTQAQLQQQMAAAQGGWQNQLQLQQMKNQGNMAKTLATSRTKLNAEKLRLLNSR
jgi:hypothetical protein